VGPETAKAGAIEMVDRLWGEEVDFLRELVQRPSTRGETNRVQSFIADFLRGQGLRVRQVGIDPGRLARLRGFSPVDWSYEGLFNVVALGTGVGGGRSLVLNGHADVVSPEPSGHWRFDPWGAQVVDGRMFGRGTADMKAGIAAMVYALIAVWESGVRMKGDVMVQTVIDEECSGNGTLACLADGFVGDAAIVPEPSGLTLITAQPGVLWCRIEVTGRAAHARSAHSAVNAAEKAFCLMGPLRDLEREWNRDVDFELASLEHPINFNLGTVRAGDWPSTVPEVCTLGLRLGFPPRLGLEAAKAAVMERIEAACEADSWLRETPPQVAFVGFHAEGAVYNLDTPIAWTVGANHEELLGRPLATGPSAATTDNRIFENCYRIPNLVYGPTGDQLHAPDEWVDLDSVRTLTRVLAAVLIDWCGAA
jgi:acetylornithine deacetylase